MGLPLSKAHWGLLCVLNTEEMGAMQKAHTKLQELQESNLHFAIHKLCFCGEKPSLALVSNDVTLLTLARSCSNKEKLRL